MLLRLVGLATRTTASKAWQAMASALLAGHGLLGDRSRAFGAVLATAPLSQTQSPGSRGTRWIPRSEHFRLPLLASLSSKGKALKAAAIRVKPPAIRRRGVARSPFFKDIVHAFPDVTVAQRHRTKGTMSASTCLVECADADADEIIPVAMVMLRDTGAEVIITECDIVDSAPKELADALGKLVSYDSRHDGTRPRASPFAARSSAHLASWTLLVRPSVLGPGFELCLRGTFPLHLPLRRVLRLGR